MVNQEQREKHILNSIINARHTFPDKYFQFTGDAIRLYIDKSEQEEYDTEIFMDVHLHHYPLRDYKLMWPEMNNIVKDYSKFGKRNKNAIEHNKLGKHMMHLIRLYMMCLDILEKEEIITFREKEHDLLMDIRNGKYLDGNRQGKESHSDLLESLNIEDSHFNASKTFVRVELVPPEGNKAVEVEKWKYIVDQDIVPDNRCNN